MDSKICVLGLGYIGLPTASMFAIHGFWVVGVDISADKVETINSGRAHIREPGLDTMVTAATHSGHLVARMAPEKADVFIIAVPTPVTADKRADLSAVVAASESIVPVLRPGNLVILESTVPPGTCRDVVIPILEKAGLKAGADFLVAHAPERVLPGQIMAELVQNDRIMGGIDRASAERARDLYAHFVAGNIYLTDATTAEMAKLVENTYRDVNIALANELARISTALKTNVWEIIELANKHPRVHVLQPGPGVGGHCIPVDPWFIVEGFPEEAQLIRAARLRNDSMPAHVCERIMDTLAGIEHPIVTVLGVAYKANVDDVRESPSCEIIRELEQAGCAVKVHDPHVHPGVSLEEAVAGSDCLALLVDHREYQELRPEVLAQHMRHKRLFAARKIAFDAWHNAGFVVQQLGNAARSWN
jgi:UDP-N-acetyl-D-mannosaminuronic acid dehydrogenase